MKVNGLGLANRSLSSNNVRRPPRRVEVSPPRSPEFPRIHFHHSASRYGTYAHPAQSPPHRLGYSLNSDSFRRYAFSEAPRGTRPLTSTSEHGTLNRRSLRQTAAPQPAMASAAFGQSADYGSRWSYNQTVGKQDQRDGDKMLGAVPPEEAVSWLARVRREGLRRLNSYPPSLTSVEMDVGKQMEVEVPLQRMQSQNFMTLPSENKAPEMTLERAVNLLTQDNEDTLTSAASHIQSQCLKSADAKKMVCLLLCIVSFYS
ncbi:hypothetical protein EYF80_014297 [Liparis tanakae]|uniref:Uncharacterized protein n=1 Tax=Liparis tanakae TaxID=230148 RepID=A0A4Z2ID80_9TELE|nr:hypothetical protein EYF80_014297 [Liparis tanakae]